jgi:hypothetical protein
MMAVPAWSRRIGMGQLLGRYFLRPQRKLNQDLRDEFNVIVAATLTLLGLIIGFSFSLASNRYDLRRTCEEAEANAIGTEYVRFDVLPASDANRLRPLLRSYLDQRVAFYLARNDQEIQQINARTVRLQAELWSAILVTAAAKPTPIAALAVSGMNDVLNSQGYAQAAFWNRIPTAAWALMATIAIGANLLIGYGSRNNLTGAKLLPILPVLVSVAFMFIADIDTPQNGIILVKPHNLMALSESLRPSNAAGAAGDFTSETTTKIGETNH